MLLVRGRPLTVQLKLHRAHAWPMCLVSHRLSAQSICLIFKLRRGRTAQLKTVSSQSEVLSLMHCKQLVPCLQKTERELVPER